MSIMRIAGTVQDSIVDGPGLRFVVFAQGCLHNCHGCQNPETHDPAGGTAVSVDALIRAMTQNPLTDGLTLSGGDPFLQAEDCARLARAAHEANLTVWTYTGYLYETLAAPEAPASWRALLEETDVLVDGPFLLSQKSHCCVWRGSRNQRLIHVRESLRKKRPVLWAPPAHPLPFERPEF